MSSAEHIDANLAPVSLDTLLSVLLEHGVAARACDLARTGDGAAPVDARAHAVRGMAIDSRQVSPGNLFVCKGAAFSARFLAAALAQGASACLCEGQGDALDIPEDLVSAARAGAPAGAPVPCLAVADVRRAMALAAPVVFDHPDRSLEIVGITGTKGKSTVSYMLCSILRKAGIVPSVLGSIETDDGAQRFESHNTTPEAPDLWRHLRNTVDAGRHHMVMEVSSQGLKYDRVLGLPFSIGCFLNIGRDHISAAEHPTFEDYFESKLKLFDQCGTAVVNLRTERADEVLAAARRAHRVVTFAVADGRLDADLRAFDVAPGAGGISFTVEDRLGHEPVRRRIELGMPGMFNVDNALAAIAMARLLGIGYEAIGGGLARLRVPGRMELVGSPADPVFAIVDYAHNELSFKTLFESVKAEYPERRVIALFGAPGGKARERREALPRVAGSYADLIIYTEEDPAHERVEDICAELAANTPEGVAYEVIPDREDAVRRAFEAARMLGEPSVVLLLAKGDETRQHRGDEYPEVVSDLALAREML